MTESGQEKEYGKLTANQFKTLIEKLSEIRKQDKELAEIVRTVPKKRLEELLPKDYAWSDIYEESFVEHVALVMLVLDKVEFVKQNARAYTDRRK